MDSALSALASGQERGSTPTARVTHYFENEKEKSKLEIGNISPNRYGYFPFGNGGRL